MGKTRDLFKKIRDTNGKLHSKMGTIKYSNCMDLIESQQWESPVGCRLWGHTESDTTEATLQQQQQNQKTLRRGGKNTQKNYAKKISKTQITTVV